MIKKFMLITSIMLIFIMSGCSQKNSDNYESADNIDASTEIEESIIDETETTEEVIIEEPKIEAGKVLFDSSTEFKDLPDGLVIEKEYIVGYHLDGPDYNFMDVISNNAIDYAYIITNNSGIDIGYKFNIEAVDEHGFNIEDVREYSRIIPNGESVFISGNITLDADEVDKVDHLVISVTENSDYGYNISNDISFTVEREDEHNDLEYHKDLVITTTNNSEYTADSILVYYVLYDENGVIKEIGHQGFCKDFGTLEPAPETLPGANGVIEVHYKSGSEIQFYDYEIYIVADRL